MTRKSNDLERLDKELLKLMDSKWHYEDGISWQTLRVIRNGHEICELASHWEPTTNVEHAMDLLNNILSKGFEVDMYSDGNTWSVKIGDFGGRAGTLSLAICDAAIQILEKNYA